MKQAWKFKPSVDEAGTIEYRGTKGIEETATNTLHFDNASIERTQRSKPTLIVAECLQETASGHRKTGVACRLLARGAQRLAMKFRTNLRCS